jgi:hypothetical protein
MATGFGSFLFHGPLAPGGEWIHDVTLAWLVLLLATYRQRREHWARLPGLAVLAFAFALEPSVADGITAALAAIAIIRLLRADRSSRTTLPLTLLAAVALLGRLGSTDGPWCNPESILQPHGLWHVGAAVAVTWWAIGRESHTATNDYQSAKPRIDSEN